MDDKVRQRLIETTRVAAKSPPSTEEVLVAGRRQRWRIRWAVAALAAIAGLVVVLVSYAGFYGRAAVRPFDVPLVSQPTLVPNVVGASLAAARDRLEGAGLKAEPAAPCEPYGACRVMAQSPPPGARVERGIAVELRLAPPGPRLVAVPAVVGLDLDAAVRALRDAGLGFSAGRQCPEPDLPCRVMEQSPAGGSKVQRGSPIRLVLRGGELVTVPDLIGLPERKAREIIEERGLAVDALGCAGEAECKVKRQNPPGGKEVVRETRVTLELEPIAPEPDTTKVPLVVGLLEREAVAALRKADLKAELRSPCPAGATCEVEDQSIAPGATVEVGETVVLSLRVQGAPPGY